MITHEPRRFLVIMYAVGLVGHLIPLLHPLMFLLTPPVLLVTGLVALYPAFKKGKTQFTIWFLLAWGLTYAIEILGVKTGRIFGVYTYGANLGPGFFGVPLIIGFNWIVVIYCSVAVAHRFTKKIPLIVLMASVLTVGYDIVLEPVAIMLKYWSWSGGIVPLQNYIAWWVISIVCILLLHLMRITIETQIPSFYLAVHYIYFLAMNILFSLVKSIS